MEDPKSWTAPKAAFDNLRGDGICPKLAASRDAFAKVE
jgi:rubredoxin